MKRSSTLAIAGLAAALMIVAASGYTQTRPAAAKPAARAGSSAARGAAAKKDTVLARIGKETLTARDVQERIDGLPEPYRTNYSTPDGRRQFMERLIEERVWLLAARKHGIASRPEVKSQLEASERDLLIRTYINEVMAENAAPSDSEAKVYYETHAADYRQPATITLSHIQSKTEADAKRVKLWAKGGQEWTKLAARYSTDSLTRATGGNLGTVTHDGVFASIGAQPALAESAFALGSHAIGGPYQTARGWHVLKVDTVRVESVRPFEQVRSVIVRQLGQSRTQEFYKERLEREKAALGYSADSSGIQKFVSQKASAQELFRKGQEGTVPSARIAAYQRVVDEYPDSDVSPQSQFMIGFINSEELKNYDEAEKAFRELLRRYPKSELAESAHWMLDHMRTEEAPPFMNPDSARRTPTASGAKPSPGKP